MPENIPVRVRDCACPDTPHEEGDFVYLSPVLDYHGGVIAERQLLALSDDEDALTDAWGETFMRHGVTGWNLVDAAGEAVPYDVGVLLADYRLSRPVASRAIELYAETVISPFVTTPPARSPTKRTASTTSRRSTATQTSV